MSDEHTNPSAFPWYHPSDGRVGPSCECGMTLRDYFAGQALAGSLANTDAPTPEVEAQWAYEIADAMLAERAKEPKAK